MRCGESPAHAAPEEGVPRTMPRCCRDAPSQTPYHHRRIPQTYSSPQPRYASARRRRQPWRATQGRHTHGPCSRTVPAIASAQRRGRRTPQTSPQDGTHPAPTCTAPPPSRSLGKVLMKRLRGYDVTHYTPPYPSLYPPPLLTSPFPTVESPSSPF